jgi:putative oxidoreductase
MKYNASKFIHSVLWILQVALAAAFGLAGFMKLTLPIEELAKQGMSFVNDYAVDTVRLIGISEVLGALGLILPAALRIKPILTPIAALGLTIIMVLATIYHAMHNEPIVTTVLFLVITLFIAWGRLKKAPIQAK